ncbi:MAG TPA: tetratricopeptide repeat protein [Polyangiaceae bacterium]
MGAFFGRQLARTAWIVGALALVPARALAQDPSADDLARRHFDSGAAYLQESDYENALKAFQKAYELSKRPAILINIATVEERRGNLDGAIKALKSYLELEPTGEHAETTKLRLQNLEKRASEQAPPPVAPAPAPAPAAAAAPPPPAREPAKPAPVPKDDAGAADRMPAYVAFGVGGVAAIGAVVTGIMANSKYQAAKSDCSPACSDAELSSGRTLATVSTIATGVAVVGAGFGLVLWLSTPSSEAAAASAQLRIGLGSGGPRAEAAFEF